MKKSIIIALAAILSTAAVAKEFTVKGTTSTTDNDKTAYLYDYNTRTPIDSCKIADGKFAFDVKVEKPTICRFMIEGNDNFDDLIVDNFPVEVVMGETGFSSLKAEKGLNVEYAEVVDAATAFNSRIEVLMDSLQTLYPNDRNAVGQAMSDIAMPLLANVCDMFEKKMTANADNALGIYCAWKWSDFRVQNIEQLDSLFAVVPLAKEFLPLKQKREEFEVEKLTGPGSMFKDFAAKSADGKPVMFSNYVGKGKYVLADFWASWCGPCMEEVPNLKFLHETYPDLVVLGVNVWDKHDKFLNAMAKKGMTWTSIYASDNKTATDLYGIKGIPTIILFAPDGTIVDRSLRGEEMKEFIAELFKEKQ